MANDCLGFGEVNAEERMRALELELAGLEARRHELRTRIKSLKEETSNSVEASPILGKASSDTAPTTTTEKLNLFLKLFRGRQDIYAKRWENLRTKKSGYAPVCANEWVKPLCEKPRVKCAECAHQKFLFLDERAVEAHLKGQTVVGTYAIRSDDTCIFLACDFDDKSWRDDVDAYKAAAAKLGVDVAVERSRSGEGAHGWIFFLEPIPASMARSLGTLILAQCHTHRPFMRLESFDRFFPSQDYLPRGGFGNLIALPLQKAAREDGNTCFVDESFRPVSDPWNFLSKVRCLGSDEVKALIERESPRMKTVIKEQGVFDDIAWTRDNEIIAFDRRSVETQEFEIENIEVTLDSMIHIPTTGLPSTLISRLKRCATFANPEFYKLQRMRMQTYPHRRFIFSGELLPDRLVLPRGLLDDVLKLLRLTGANITLHDERVRRRRVKLSFMGELTEMQKKAVGASKTKDLGVLVAPPGAGKTVMACAIMAERKVSTLVLVHRQPLLEQWRESLHRFLDVPLKEIGRLSGSKKKITGKIDLAMLQSLSRLEDLAEIGKMYSQIIIDECHHIPDSSFEAILKLLPARYVLGLTATPNRKDGLEKILYQQCGPVRYELMSVNGGLLEKVVHVHKTGWTLPVELGPKPPYHLVMEHLVNDTERNQLIIEATIERLNGGEFPLLVADRKAHLDKLSDLLVGHQNSLQASVEILRLDGEMSPKQRQLGIANARKLRSEDKLVLLVATGSLVGEGFDLPELDALILAVPLSFEGRLIQYVGRIHRVLDGKAKVQVVDFFDAHSPMFIKMYRNRMRAYRKMGYEIREQFGAEIGSRGRAGFFNF